MKLSEMRSGDEVLAEELHNPQFAASWQATALARAVAIEVVRYRGAHELSQAELARQLGMRQPQVARIEAGEVTPTIETLVRLAAALDIEFAIDVRPAGRRPVLASGDAGETVEANGAAVTVATSGMRRSRKAAGAAEALAGSGRPRRVGSLVGDEGMLRETSVLADLGGRRGASGERSKGLSMAATLAVRRTRSTTERQLAARSTAKRTSTKKPASATRKAH